MKTLIKEIAEQALFRTLGAKHLEVLAEGAKEATLRPGQVLFREGEPANRFYLIQSGRIALEAHEPANATALVQNVGPGDVVGWSWLFPPFVWHFQACALEPTKVILLDGAHLLAAAERDHDFGYELLRRIAQVVIHRLQMTRKRLLAETRGPLTARL